MAKVELKLPHHSYELIIEPGLLSRMGPLVKAVAPNPRAAILADENVFKDFGKPVQASLESAGYNVVAHAFPSGEDNKTLANAALLYEVLIANKFERKSPVLAIGGGVAGDTVGFVAGTYQRGVPFVQIPTTLLAMVDSSVGGKTGVNLPGGKNMVGVFHQPNLVIIDTDTLATLPVRELRCGLAECVKHGVIRDETLFQWIGANLDKIFQLDPAALVELVRRNVQIKANVVMADEKETGERAHLNYGHTFGHAIEATAGYGTYHHGEAISLGMVAATRLAAELKFCDASLVTRLVDLLDAIGLPTSATNLAPTPALLDKMRVDKKVSGGKIRLVLPRKMGDIFITADVSDAAIADAWETLRA